MQFVRNEIRLKQSTKSNKQIGAYQRQFPTECIWKIVAWRFKFSKMPKPKSHTAVQLTCSSVNKLISNNISIRLRLFLKWKDFSNCFNDYYKRYK